jgi:hypothetical protein
MKFALTLFLAMGLTVVARGGTFTNESSATASNIKIKWSKSVQSWPKLLWIYKVIPQDFSELVISNLLNIGSFSAKDRKSVTDFTDTKDEVFFYGDLDGSARHLAICPALGFIEYHDGKAKSYSQLQKVIGVPNEKEATDLGLKYLELLGIDSSELSRKTGTNGLNIHWERQTIEYDDPTNKLTVTQTNAYGVFFLRSVNGIDVTGIGLNGGAYMCFGNDGKPVNLQVSWRKLQPYSQAASFSRNQISKRIKGGLIPLYLNGSKSQFNGKISKMDITSAQVLYTGSHYDQAMDFASPFARFQADGESGTNKISIWFESSMNSGK